MIRGLFLVIVLSLLSVYAAGQTTWYVDASATPPGTGSQTSPFTAIQDGIDAASSGDTVLVAPGTYFETITIQGKNLNLLGAGGPAQTTIDAQQSGTVVTIGVAFPFSTVTVEISGFVIRGGRGADGSALGCSPTSGMPGGISARFASVTIKNCWIQNNTGGRGGDAPCFGVTGGAGGTGGLHCEDGDATLEDCVIVSNRGGDGGLDSTLNNPGASGGVVLERGTLVLKFCQVITNVPGFDATSTSLPPMTSAPAVSVDGSLSAIDCGFTANDGGISAVLLTSASSTPPSTGSFTRCQFTNNNGAEFSAGAVFAASEGLVMENCEFRNNSSGAVGGAGTILSFSSSVAISRCRFFFNAGPNGAGAISLTAAAARISECVFANNTGLAEALRLVSGVGSDYSVSNSIFLHNSATGGGAPGAIQYVVTTGLASICIKNCVVRGGSFPRLVLDAPAILENSNVEGGFPGPGNIDLPPRFVDPMNDDYRLRLDSPCIDAGLNTPDLSPTDFEGDPRIIGGTVDIGIDEYGFACSNGNVTDGSTGAFAPLQISGSSGAIVSLAIGQPFTVSLLQPPGTPNPAHFILWGLIGEAQRSSVFALPIGDMCFAPNHLVPADPFLFTVANAWNPSDPLALAPGSPTPFSVTDPDGCPFPAAFTFQAVIEDPSSSPGPIAVTNAVVLDVR